MRILLCTDGSPHGQAALRFGVLLARGSSEPATLLGVLESSGQRPKLEQALQEGQALLAGAPQPRLKVRQGHAAQEILAEASPEDYDLVVVGTRGRRGLARFLLGSTAERIARSARLPVLLVQGHRSALARILVCTGGDKPGLAAVALGGRVARLAGAPVTVLHVMSQVSITPVLPEAAPLKVMPQTPAPPQPSKIRFEDLEVSTEDLITHDSREGVHLRQALAILEDLGVPATARVRRGLVVDEIEAEAWEGDYDLLVVGSQTTEGWMRFLLNDLGQQILSCIDRPILVTRV